MRGGTFKRWPGCEKRLCPHACNCFSGLNWLWLCWGTTCDNPKDSLHISTLLQRKEETQETGDHPRCPSSWDSNNHGIRGSKWLKGIPFPPQCSSYREPQQPRQLPRWKGSFLWSAGDHSTWGEVNMLHLPGKVTQPYSFSCVLSPPPLVLFLPCFLSHHVVFPAISGITRQSYSPYKMGPLILYCAAFRTTSSSSTQTIGFCFSCTKLIKVTPRKKTYTAYPQRIFSKRCNW